jgi:hypothetical protein
MPYHKETAEQGSVDKFKNQTYCTRALVDASDQSGEASMSATAARHEADKILGELPDRISDVIKPFVRQGPDHPALVQAMSPGPMATLRPSWPARRLLWRTTASAPAIGS